MNGDQQQAASQGKSRAILFTGGMNNNVGNPLRLFFRGKAETSYCYNADLAKDGSLQLLRPLKDTLGTAEEATVHSVFRSKDVILAGVGTDLKYRDVADTVLTTLISDLSGDPINFSAVGNWVFYTNGTNQGSIYLPTMTACSWGTDPPPAPTVVLGAGGNPNDTYQCAYRWNITLPDGTLIQTDLSDSAEIVATSDKIEWSNITFPSFTGAVTVEAELYRTAAGWADYYLIATLSDGTTTYSDDTTDATAQASTTFDETGYYGPPANTTMLYYHAGADRIFAAVGNDIYWSEAGMYHVFVYDELVDEYDNVNSVYLENQAITALLGFDEQMYIGCSGTWRRLRGTSPDTWFWESIEGAIAGPLGWRSCVVTQIGIIYPGNDRRLWVFNGFDTKRILEHYSFATTPDATTIGAYDGRFFFIFYSDIEIVVDTIGWPGQQMKVVESTRSAASIFYDRDHGQMYIGTSGGQIQNGTDEDTDVTLSFRTADIPISGLTELDTQAALLIFCDTKGDDLSITPVYDGVDQDPLTPVSTDSIQYVVVPIALGTIRTVGFKFSITSHEDILLVEPWLIVHESDADIPE